MESWAIITAVSLIAASLLVLLIIMMKNRRGPTQVFIVGQTGSGKTALFYQLSAQKFLNSITSQTRNKATIQVKGKPVIIVDMPGHPRIHTEVLGSMKDADALIFVIDSVTVMSQINDIANVLYDILSQPEIMKKKVPVLIVGSKMDSIEKREIDVIKQELEKEMDFIRSNRQQSNYVESGGSEFFYLGTEGAEFGFEQISSKVQFASCSVKNNDIGHVREFVESLI